MANSPMSLTRRCLGFVSRIGSLTPQSPPSTSTVHGEGGGYPIPETSSKHHGVAGAVAIGVSLAAMLGLIILIAVVMRRKAIRRQQLSSGTAAGEVPETKGGEGDAVPCENGKWSAVELVVMAGEVAPTFIAHPVPAFSDSVVIQCPPFNLHKDPQ